MNLKLVVSERIQQGMYENRIEFMELKRRTSIDAQGLRKYVYGESLPSIPSLVKIASALKYSTDYILGLTDQKEKK